MKKLGAYILILLALGLVLCGCGEAETPAVSPPVTEPPPVSTPEETSVPRRYILAGKSYTADAESIDLTALKADDVSHVLDALQNFSALSFIEMGTAASESEQLPWSVIERLHKVAPNAVINYGVTLYGKAFNLSDDTLDIKYVQIHDGGALVRQVIDCMPNLRTLDMDSCGLDNETMAQLREDYPQVKVIWRIFFGDNYTARTDVERILASAPDIGGELIHDNVMDLKYCIYVKYLDLGHNNYMDTLEFIRYMPDLEVGIFAMSNIEDFSPLADCPKLEYLEIQTSRLHDLTPLSGLKNLKHLNICYCFAINDITALYPLTQLERLWIGCYDPIPPEQIEKMQELAPDCVINTTTTDPTNEGWRMGDGDAGGYPTYAPRYALLRKQFGYSDSDYALCTCDPLYQYSWQLQ